MRSHTAMPMAAKGLTDIDKISIMTAVYAISRTVYAAGKSAAKERRVSSTCSPMNTDKYRREVPRPTDHESESPPV